MEDIFQLLSLLVQLAILLAEYAERKQRSTNKKTSSIVVIIIIDKN